MKTSLNKPLSCCFFIVQSESSLSGNLFSLVLRNENNIYKCNNCFSLRTELDVQTHIIKAMGGYGATRDSS